MRPLEIVIVLMCFAVVLSTFILRRKWPQWVRLLVAASGSLVLLHGWVEGLHWQMIPVYLAVALLVFGLRCSSSKYISRPWLASLAGGLLVCGLVLSWILPVFHLPRPTGRYPVATRTLYFVDPSRQETHPGVPPGQREVVVQTWFPSARTKGHRAPYREWKETDLRSSYQAVVPTDSLQDADIAAGRFPVILFNHAWRGFRNRSTFLMQELASQGFVVVAIGHPYNAAIVELHDGRIADGRKQPDLGDFEALMTLEQRLSLASSELKIQTADDRFVLDELTKLDKAQGNPFSGHLDLTRVGAFGHSFGGAVSVELASTDARVLSALELDGTIYGKAAQEGMRKPLMRIGQMMEPLPPGPDNEPTMTGRVYLSMRRKSDQVIDYTYTHYGGYDVTIYNIDHENFDDKGFFSPVRSLTGVGSMPVQQAASLISTYTVAFFRQTLLNEPQPLLSGKIPQPAGSRMIVWPASPTDTAEKTKTGQP